MCAKVFAILNPDVRVIVDNKNLGFVQGGVPLFDTSFVITRLPKFSPQKYILNAYILLIHSQGIPFIQKIFLIYYILH